MLKKGKCHRDLKPENILYSYINGYDLAKSCIIANWVASKSVQAIGISGLPDLNELEEFIRTL